ncbi:MAG: hypothetical protein ABIH66_01050 [bacterium]
MFSSLPSQLAPIIDHVSYPLSAHDFILCGSELYTMARSMGRWSAGFHSADS